MPHTNYEFLQRLESAFPGGVNGSWYIYAALVCQANDRMEFIGDIWGHVKPQTPDTEEQLVKARKLREALLKASVLVGFPKVRPISLSSRAVRSHGNRASTPARHFGTFF